MNGPLPSTRVFLSDLPSLPVDSKVRFLGCVKTYHISTGHLILEHNYPRVRQPRSEPPCVSVDINAVLETVTWEELRVGAWINVIGYVRRAQGCPSPGATAAVATDDATMTALNGKETRGSVYVDAVMVFSAGAIALGEYERILHDSKEVDRRVQRPS
ncbi:hypothetical protein P175DRAFT_0467549 [Aspergillus ochraceoroseus IBT 24754]|uniref:CST complex subunit Ten1 n=1 Tax=Aspergillus ochraceoroseus IBT 24754 TaxID=1392256 RepID=A0A2T5LLG1_9EURO|nr:uncharacterized protein P175DRAFT_0467549 [Aspergillus ochraceoroseus IBT 24754]PTU17109.1 hypothetical protein P175DRAFT_0467549 [Aspergillus ochraceoroseus IBT 24754]